MANATNNLSNMFVYVPSTYVNNFISNHIGENKESDDYYRKISFLDNGQISTRARLFGLTDTDIQKIGLSDLPNTYNNVLTYIKNLGGQIDTLNGDTNINGSVDKKVETAINNLINGAPTAFDTLKEISDWITYAQGDPTSSEYTATLVTSIPSLNTRLGSYVGSTYTGAYLFAHNAALDATNALSHTDTEVNGQYVSSVSLNNGTWTINRVNIPITEINSTSTNYLSITDQKLDALTSSISSTTGFTYTSTPAEGHTAYEVGTAETIGTGLVTASEVYTRLRADETFVASALSTMDIRIKDVVNNTVGGLDETLVLTDSASYITTTVVQQDGKLTDTGSSITFDYAKIYAELDSTTGTVNATENGTTYGSMSLTITDGKISASSLSINKTNILKENEATTTSGTNTDPFQVSVVEENHKIKTVSIQFNDLSTLWDDYQPSL